MARNKFGISRVDKVGIVNGSKRWINHSWILIFSDAWTKMENRKVQDFLVPKIRQFLSSVSQSEGN